jgi:hypothetical protein
MPDRIADKWNTEMSFVRDLLRMSQELALAEITHFYQQSNEIQFDDSNTSGVNEITAR